MNMSFHDYRLLILLRYAQQDHGEAALASGEHRVGMLHYCMHSLFAVPQTPLEVEEVAAPRFRSDVDGMDAEIQARWLQCAAASLDKQENDAGETENRTNRTALGPVFVPSPYPYMMPEVPVETLVQEEAGEQNDVELRFAKGQHWNLWYYHDPSDPDAISALRRADPGNEKIDIDVGAAVSAVARGLARSCSRADSPDVCLNSDGEEEGEGEKNPDVHCDYIWYRNPKMSVPEVFHVQVFFRIRRFHRRRHGSAQDLDLVSAWSDGRLGCQLGCQLQGGRGRDVSWLRRDEEAEDFDVFRGAERCSSFRGEYSMWRVWRSKGG